MSRRETSNELEVGNLFGLPDVAGISNDMLGTSHQFLWNWFPTVRKEDVGFIVAKLLFSSKF